MPKVNIFENDNTGASLLDEAVAVFVPGDIDIKEGRADDNGCVVIAADDTDLSEYFESTDYGYSVGSTNTIHPAHIISLLQEWGYGVVYKKMGDATYETKDSYMICDDVVDPITFANSIHTVLYTKQEDGYVVTPVYKDKTTYYEQVYEPVVGPSKQDIEKYLIKVNGKYFPYTGTDIDSNITYYTKSYKVTDKEVTADTFKKNTYYVLKNAGDISVYAKAESATTSDPYYRLAYTKTKISSKEQFDAVIKTGTILYTATTAAEGKTKSTTYTKVDSGAEFVDETIYYTLYATYGIGSDTSNCYTLNSNDVSGGSKVAPVFELVDTYEPSGDEIAYYEEITTYAEKRGIDSVSSWDFLNDKNAYNLKFLTTGNYFTVPVYNKDDESIDAELRVIPTVEETNWAFDFTTLNALLPLAGSRKDCALLVDLDYYDGENAPLTGITGNDLAGAYKKALEYTNSGDKAYTPNYFVKEDASGNKISSRAYTLLPNCNMSYSVGANTYTIKVPSSLVYLYNFAMSERGNNQWLPSAGVTRGTLNSLFTPDLEISKYYLDTNIISDSEGVSFNGIVNVRPYGYTIWGDRTLLDQEALRGVQATSYMSIRNLVSDIAHRAYESAIQHTYETNNDVTWLNFKSQVVTLLDQMKTSGVVQTYEIGRSVTEEYNKMVMVITVYINLPVENFDIYVNLENAEVSVSE